MTGSRLTEEQVAEARRLWTEGRTLMQVATALGCTLYDLSPWLYTEGEHVARIAPPEDDEGDMP